MKSPLYCNNNPIIELYILRRIGRFVVNEGISYLMGEKELNEDSIIESLTIISISDIGG